MRVLLSPQEIRPQTLRLHPRPAHRQAGAGRRRDWRGRGHHARGPGEREEVQMRPM